MKKQVKHARLSRTDFEWPGDKESVINARKRFFAAVQVHAPRVLQDLAQQPLSEYVAIANIADPVSIESWRELEKATSQGALFDELFPLRDALMAWSKRWHLDVDWCLERALSTLRRWAELPASDPPGQRWSDEPIPIFHRVSPARAWPRFLFTYPAADLSRCSRSEYDEKLRKSFEDKLKQYLDEVESLAQAKGMEPTPTKRNDDHFQWLVFFQIHEIPYEKVADTVPASTPTVRDAVKSTAKLIGLPLRTGGKSGRPRKTTV